MYQPDRYESLPSAVSVLGCWMSTRSWLYGGSRSSGWTVIEQPRAPECAAGASTWALMRVPFFSLMPGLNSAVAAPLEQTSPLLFASKVAVQTTAARAGTLAAAEQRKTRRTWPDRTKFFIDIPDAGGGGNGSR